MRPHFLAALTAAALALATPLHAEEPNVLTEIATDWQGAAIAQGHLAQALQKLAAAYQADEKKIAELQAEIDKSKVPPTKPK